MQLNWLFFALAKTSCALLLTTEAKCYDYLRKLECIAIAAIHFLAPFLLHLFF